VSLCSASDLPTSEQRCTARHCTSALGLDAASCTGYGPPETHV